MNAPNPQPCRSPYRLYVANGAAALSVPLYVCKQHWMQVDATLVPQRVPA